MFKRKPKSGYQTKPKKEKQQKSHYVHSLFVAPTRKVSIGEKIVKFIIFIALRLVIKPSKWKNPAKNYEIIDRTYKRIMSADFVYIPSSIAFYLIMAFMPIVSIIMLIYNFDGYQHLFAGDSKTGLIDVIGKFIPGSEALLQQLNGATHSSAGAQSGAVVAIIISLVISTWIAAGGFSKLIWTQSYIYGHKFSGGYWMNKFKGMAMVLAFTLFLLIALTINVSITSSIKHSGLSGLWKDIFTYTFLVVGLFVGCFFGFGMLYKFSPRFKIKFKNVIPGAMITTIPTAGFLALFGTISSFWHYGSYGSIGVIMYIGMAALIITYFIFVGLAANAAYYKTFVSKVMRNKRTISRK